jgi:transposase, IS30 family
MDFEIRKDRGPQGRRKLTRERAAYFELMQQGYSSREACRIVGIDVRTGKKWRNGSHAHIGKKKAAPPIYQEAPPSGPSRYLCEADRIHIADRLREKATVRAIAAELGRSPSTISREIRRNRRRRGGHRHDRPSHRQCHGGSRRRVGAGSDHATTSRAPAG